jgi:hypothetical protein
MNISLEAQYNSLSECYVLDLLLLTKQTTLKFHIIKGVKQIVLPSKMTVLAWVAVTNYHRLGVLRNKYLFLIVLEAEHLISSQ